MDLLREYAPAKVNLTLRVLGRRTDGFHELESLVAFAGVGDELTLEPGASLALELSGRGAIDLTAEADNLVLRAARALADRVSGLITGRFQLVKNLPVASGIGGGSSDAAAALRLLARANGLALDDARMMDAAATIGSDVPVCLDARARMMSGRGEQLGPALALPELHAVLVNPRVTIPTPAVFAELGLMPGTPLKAVGQGPFALSTREELLESVRASSNDLEGPAIRLCPRIDAVREALEAAGYADLIRMSGSGATVFALYPRQEAAEVAARHVAALRPGWWVAATVLR